MTPRQRDIARIAVQTAAACALTWFAVRWLGLSQHTSWGMISSLLVVQASVDETMQATAFRVLATLLGTCLGLASAWLLPSADLILLRLMAVAAIVNALGMKWPGLRFGIVPATILVLSPGGDLFDAAIPRALAIIVGAGTGFVAATLVWPDRSRNRALRAARKALLAAGDLLGEVLGESSEKSEGRLEELHAAFTGNLQQARTAASGARVGRKLKTGRPISELLRELERLWHGIIMLERVIVEDAFNLPPGTLPKLRPAIDEVTSSVREALDCVEHSLALGRPLPDFERHAKRLLAARTTAQALSGSLAGGRTPGSERALGTLVFGLDEVARHLLEIIDTLSPGTVGSSTSAEATEAAAHS